MGKGMGDRGRDRRHMPEGKAEGVRPSQGLGAGTGPRGKVGKGDIGPRGQAGRGVGARGDGQGVGRGTGSGAPPQPDVQPVRCIPPGIQQMPAHPIHYHHHHHAHLYNIDPDAGDLVLPQPPRPPYQPALQPHCGAPRGPSPAARRPRAEPARMAAALAARGFGAAQAPQAQEPQEEPARGAEGARGHWARDWDAIRDPLVVEVYEWLSWATSGTTRGLRNWQFDSVLLRRDWGNRKVPPGGWMAQEDHERVLLSCDSGGEPTRPAFLEGGAVLRVTDAEANNWPLRALHTVVLPPEEPAAAGAPAPTQAAAMVPGGGHRGGGRGQAARDTPPAGPGPLTQSAPPPPPAVRTAGGCAPPPVGERMGGTNTPTRATRGSH